SDSNAQFTSCTRYRKETWVQALKLAQRDYKDRGTNCCEFPILVCVVVSWAVSKILKVSIKPHAEVGLVGSPEYVFVQHLPIEVNYDGTIRNAFEPCPWHGESRSTRRQCSRRSGLKHSETRITPIPKFDLVAGNEGSAGRLSVHCSSRLELEGGSFAGIA